MLLLLSFVLLAIYYRQKEGPTNRCPKTNEPSCLAELLRYNIIHRLIASGLRYHFQSAVQWSLQTGGGDRDDKYIVIESNPHFWSSPWYYDPPLPVVVVAHSLLVLLNFLLTLGITDWVTNGFNYRNRLRLMLVVVSTAIEYRFIRVIILNHPSSCAHTIPLHIPQSVNPLPGWNVPSKGQGPKSIFVLMP